jgi:hypothetical protein
MANHLKKNAEKFNRHVVVFRDPANESWWVLNFV